MQAGLAGVHGNVSSFGSANGISVVALADFGKPGVGGVDGSSGATGKSSSGGSASINNDEDEIEDDDLLALLEGATSSSCSKAAKTPSAHRKTPTKATCTAKR